MQQNNERIAKNTFVLTLRMFFTIALGIYSSRIILMNLGVEDYGVYNVIGGIISLFGFLNATMANSSQRFYNYYLGKNDYIRLNSVFNISIKIHVIIALVIIFIGETVGLYFLNNSLNIPASRMIAANWIYQFTIISASINIISTPYYGLIIASEKMTTFAYIAIVQSICMLFFAFAISWIPFDRLIVYGFFVLLFNINLRLFYSWYSKSRFSYLHFVKVNEKKLYREILSFTGWSLLSTIAYMLYTQGITFLINVFFNPIVNAAQALANQVNASLNTFYSNFIMAVKPQIVKSYAENNMEYMEKLVLLGSKISFFIMLLVSLPFIVRTDYILSLWLKEVPKYTNLFLQLNLWIAIWCSISNLSTTAVQATGNVKWFYIVESTLLIIILPLCYVMLKVYGQPYVIYVTILVMQIILQLVRVIFLKLNLEYSFWRYMREIVLPLIMVCGISYASLMWTSQYIPNSFVGFIFLCLLSCILIFISFLFFATHANERSWIYNVIRSKCMKE